MAVVRCLLAGVVMFVLLVATGCAPGESREMPPESPPAGWPDSLNDFTVTWTAEPGIDATTGPAVVVRAYMESYYLAYLTDDEKYLYPGFAQSVAVNEPNGPDGTDELWPLSRGQKTWVGTLHHHLLRIERDGRDIAAVGCVYSYDTGTVTHEGVRPNVGGTVEYAGVSAIRIGLLAPESDPVSVPQEGPARAPSDNVFDDWRVTNYQGGYLSLAHWDGNARDKRECLSRAGGTPESRTRTLASVYVPSDFPKLPVSPGWPVAPG